MYHSERILETYNKINQLISKFLKGEKIYRLIAITKKSLEKKHQTKNDKKSQNTKFRKKEKNPNFYYE